MSDGEEVVRLELRATQALVTKAGDEHFVELVCPMGGGKDAKVSLKLGAHLLANVVISEGPGTIRVNNRLGRKVIERIEYEVSLQLKGLLIKDETGTMYTMEIMEEEQ